MTRRRSDNGQFVDVGKYRAIVGISVGDENFEAGKNFPEKCKSKHYQKFAEDRAHR
jgi:hypothetical protein